MPVDELINTLESPGEFDAMLTLRPGEPYFLLVGRDRSAPPLIREWAAKHRRKVLAEFEDGLITTAVRERELRKATQAEMIAESMVEYKNRWAASGREAPSSVTTYSGHEVPEETKRRDALQAARVRAASAINNAVAELAVMLELRGEPSTGRDSPTIRALMQLSEEVSPSRPLPGSAPLLETARG